MIEVDEGVRRPELATQFLSGDDFSRPFKQRRQHLKRLFLKLYLLSPLAQFPCFEIQLECAEAEDSRFVVGRHGNTSRSLTPSEDSSGIPYQIVEQ